MIIVRYRTRYNQTVSVYSDFKSSLNLVHLKIYHALIETSYLTDKETLTGFVGQ